MSIEEDSVLNIFNLPKINPINIAKNKKPVTEKIWNIEYLNNRSRDMPSGVP